MNYCVNPEYFSEPGIVNVYDIAEDFANVRFNCRSIYHKSF